ncbi:MAG: phosphodiester glycosidase family protein [Candidatus Eremiobacteraeota bacterium]|nr:phosphodiester glycosidase family protein [Candidatus Eremiobacteraeota bacterium]
MAINGGTFNGAFAPDGLLIVDGNIVGRKRADWMGMVTVDATGNCSVTTKPHLASAKYAVQGHPTIVEPGGKMGVFREDRRRDRRTVIAQSGDSIVAMVTSPISLFELAYALVERPDSFHVNGIDTALNLSGGSTTSFYAKVPNGLDVVVPAYWPNRDVIVFSPR